MVVLKPNQINESSMNACLPTKAMKKVLFILALSTAASTSSYAQEEGPAEPELTYRAVQVSFVPPLSTNGLQSTRYVNGFSLNILGGISGGLRGVELSSLFAVETGAVRGTQLAGLFNAVGGPVKGTQFGGIANLVRQEVTGAQFGGIVNVAQALDGVQFAGIANVAAQRVDGAQLAGIANVATQHLDGAQLAGIVNIAEAVEGTQVAGIVNVSAGNVKGAQIGLINVAGHVDGVQLGLINLAKDGYRRVELWGGEVLYGNVAYKMGGNRKFYSLFAVGATLPDSKNTRWGLGYGLGTNLDLGKKNQLSLEVLSYQIHEQKTSWKETNQLNQFRPSFIFPFHNQVALTLTPTFNVQVSQLKTADGTIGTEWVGWSVYNKLINGRTRVMMWPGLNVGIQF